jgi:stearoyl-CoA desaturase (delta-9 desaturase)
MALVTFGEGYHNFHHEFPSDYRNGVRPWQFDPTKWTIWILSKLGLTEGLRRIPQKKIEAAVQAEKQKLAPPPEDEDNEILPVAIMTQLGQFSREK